MCTFVALLLLLYPVVDRHEKWDTALWVVNNSRPPSRSCAAFCSFALLQLVSADAPLTVIQQLLKPQDKRWQPENYNRYMGNAVWLQARGLSRWCSLVTGCVGVDLGCGLNGAVATDVACALCCLKGY